MTRTRKVLPFVVVGALLTGGGIAAALWSANVSGPSQSKALTAQTLTVTAATGSADLYPGYALGDVFFSVANPNPYPVTITSMTPGTITTSNPACAASNLTVSSQSGLLITVGANASSGTQSIADVVSLASTAPDACQGVTFTVGLTLTGSQA